jgi:hypothetical protein
MANGGMSPVPRGTVERIRDLARRVAEAASRPEQRERIDLWKRKNALEHVRPMVLIFPEGSWEEVMADGMDDRRWPRPSSATCWSAHCRHLHDDSVVSPSSNPMVVHSTATVRST